jgi:hypothetical protein
VQAAGACLELLFPRMSTIHGAEHVLSLFCKNLLEQTQIGHLVKIYQLLYRYFGSGSTHMSYAIFRTQSAAHNNNQQIGLIQAAGTRMGGYFYAFYRLLRLKKALKQTILSQEWHNIPFQKKSIKKTGRYYTQ